MIAGFSLLELLALKFISGRDRLWEIFAGVGEGET